MGRGQVFSLGQYWLALTPALQHGCGTNQSYRGDVTALFQHGTDASLDDEEENVTTSVNEAWMTRNKWLGDGI